MKVHVMGICLFVYLFVFAGTVVMTFAVTCN